MALAPFNSVSAATDQQVVVPGPTPTGPGLTVTATNIAILAELRVISEILNTGGVDLTSLRADQLNSVVKPGVL